MGRKGTFYNPTVNWSALDTGQILFSFPLNPELRPRLILCLVPPFVTHLKRFIQNCIPLKQPFILQPADYDARSYFQLVGQRSYRDLGFLHGGKALGIMGWDQPVTGKLIGLIFMLVAERAFHFDEAQSLAVAQ